MKKLIKQTGAIAICFMCVLSMLVVATDNTPVHATPEEACTCAGQGEDCEIAIFQVDHDRRAYCALWGRKSGRGKTGCCMIDPKKTEPVS